MTKLFSIKPKYSERIYNHEKLVEFRKQNVNIVKNETCLVYSSSPQKQLSGYFIVENKIRTTIENLWEITKQQAGITYFEFKEYFKGCTHGTAIFLKKINKFTKTISLSELRILITNFRPPQSYCNLTDKDFKTLISEILPTHHINLLIQTKIM